MRVDCEKPWLVTMNANIPWTYYLDVALLLVFYFVLALEIRRRLEPVCVLDSLVGYFLKPCFSLQITRVKVFLQCLCL